LKILIVSQYFWPESFIINDIAETLKNQGHTIVIATGKPNYPKGDIYNGYASSGVQIENFSDSIEVVRVPLRPRGNGGAINLALNYFSFVWSGLRWFRTLLNDHEFDVIFVFMLSPVTLAIPAIPLKIQKKAHLVLWVQDLWPESLKTTGFVRNRFLLWLTGLMVKGIYTSADTILVQSRAFVQPVSRYARKDKIIYYPNSFLDSIDNKSKAMTVPQELIDLLEQNFCIVFAGNIGTAQSVETLLQVAIHLQHISNFKLVLIGSGSMINWLKDQKDRHKLNNLIFGGQYPSTDMPIIFKRAAGLLVTLKHEEIFSYTIPSKVQAYLAAGRPIIAALDGEGSRIIEEACAGLTCPAEDIDNLTDNIKQLYNMTQGERDNMGISARKYYLEHFEMKQQCKNLISIFEKRISELETEQK